MGEKKRKNGAPTCRAWERNFHVFYDLFMKKKQSAGERNFHVFYDLFMNKKKQSAGERNFHVFYDLCAAAEAGLTLF